MMIGDMLSAHRSSARPVMVALGGSLNIIENSAVGAVVGELNGPRQGSVLTLADDAGGLFSVTGRKILVAGALDYETATTHDIAIRETNAKATGSPKDTVLTVTITNAEMLLNGAFASGTSWTLSGANPPVIAAGKLTSNVLAVAGKATQTLTVPAGTYQLIFTVDSVTTGTVTAHLGDATGTARSTADTFTETLVVASGADFDLTFALTDAVVDNVSIERLT